jgi:hypothetical protein
MDRQSHVRRCGTRSWRVVAAAVTVLVLGAGAGACGDDEPMATGPGEGTTPSMTSPLQTSAPSSSTTTATTTSTTTSSATTTGATIATTTTTGTSAADLAQRCDNPGGFSVAYPSGWSTNTEPAPEPCVWFSPTAIVVPSEPTDALLGPVSVRIQEGASLADVSNPSPEFEQLISSEPRTIAGRSAVRIETVATGAGLLDEGTRIVSYAVEVPPGADGTPRVLTATAIECCGVAVEDATRVLDAMVTTLQLTA